MKASENNNNTEIKQVKYTVEDLGTVIKKEQGSKNNKKRISWTFSIDNQEHTVVVLVWGKNFGKRQVTEDDKFVYEETKESGNFFFYKWDSSSSSTNQEQDNTTSLHIIASFRSTPAKGKVCDGFCKFELIVNGLPFSKLPRQDGTPLPELDGPGPHGIFDIVYPQGYDVTFTKEAPFHNKRRKNNRVVLKQISVQESIMSQQAAMKAEEAVPVPAMI